MCLEKHLQCIVKTLSFFFKNTLREPKRLSICSKTLFVFLHALLSAIGLKGGSKWRQKLQYVACTQPWNAEGKLTGFVEIIALAKAPMALEDWQNLFHCRRAQGIADTEDLGALVDRARADGVVWCEKGVRARGLEDGRWVSETPEELHQRMQAEGLREAREVGDAMDAFNAQKRAQRAEEAAAATAARAGSAALAARATLAVRAAWGGRA